jgi:hypothetical protein
MIVREVNRHGLLHDSQFYFHPRLSVMLQLVCLIERLNRNSEEKRLITAVFPCVAKAFDILWLRSLP